MTAPLTSSRHEGRGATYRVRWPWPIAAMAAALAALDVVVVTLAALLSYFARFGEVAPPGLYLAAILLGVLLTVGWAHLAGAYKRSALGTYGRLARPILTSWIAVFFFLIILAFVGKISAQYSRARSSRRPRPPRHHLPPGFRAPLPRSRTGGSGGGSGLHRRRQQSHR